MKPEPASKLPQVPNLPADSTASEIAAIGAVMQPLMEGLAKTTQIQADANVRSTQIQAEADLRKFELEATASRQWNLGVLLILAAIAVAGIAFIFTGQGPTGEKLLFAVIGFFGGYGAALATRKKR